MTKTVGSIIAFLALGVLLVVGSSIKHPFVALQLVLTEPPASLPVPVDGVRPSALRNSWRAPRDGGRHHQGIDIFARPGTPVRSTTEGIVIRLGQNRLGGNVVWVMGPGRQTHYYAHLRDFGAFETGDQVMPGDIIGYVAERAADAMDSKRQRNAASSTLWRVRARRNRDQSIPAAYKNGQSGASLAATTNIPFLFGLPM